MKKDILAVLALVILAVILAGGVEIQSVEEYYRVHPEEIRPEDETVFLTIRCDTVWNHVGDLDPYLRDGGYLPADGVILERRELVLRPGDTVYDVLERATRYHEIPLETRGSGIGTGKDVYVRGIQYLYEFSCGPLSGWMYTVNGRFPEMGSGCCSLQDGDEVAWVYTCDLGRDVGCVWADGERRQEGNP